MSILYQATEIRVNRKGKEDRETSLKHESSSRNLQTEFLHVVSRVGGNT